MGGEVEKMVAVGLVWGATNALMRKGAIIWDNKIKFRPQPNTPTDPIVNTLKNWLNLLLTWQYSLPFLVNLSASATFFAILSDTPISLAVPVTNATTFAATAVFGMLLGEETHVGLALFEFPDTNFIIISKLPNRNDFFDCAPVPGKEVQLLSLCGMLSQGQV